ncbi:GNAT family N-acetyltransferase [bacterium]|nr:MAG: GNAT family N-acetyltransferase [bacterium]
MQDAIGIIQLPPDSWQVYRELRLEALQNDPQAFGGSYEEEINLTPTNWQNRLKSMWFAWTDNQIIGMIGLVQNKEMGIKHYAFLVSLWVKPAYRRQGIGALLIKHVQKDAPTKQLRKILLHVTKTQPGALRLYETVGFKKVGTLKENLFKDNRYLDQDLMEWHVSQ